MRDIGLVKFNEPVKRLLTQGMVVGETFYDESSGKRIYSPPAEVTVERDAKGKITSATSKDGRTLGHAIERMSKSKGNGVDPDEMVDIYGADAARLFVMFAAPIENELVWNESGIEGSVRFLQRLWRLVFKWNEVLHQPIEGDETEHEMSEAAKRLRRATHQTIRRVTDSFETLQFNTPVAGLMSLSNAVGDFAVEPEKAAAGEIFAVREALTSLTIMLTPFAPHAAEELYSHLIGNDEGLIANNAAFPEYNEELAKDESVEIPVQVNGKLRSKVLASPESGNDELEALALADEKVREHIAGKEVVKIVVVPGRLVSIVVKG